MLFRPLFKTPCTAGFVQIEREKMKMTPPLHENYSRGKEGGPGEGGVFFFKGTPGF